MASWDIGNVNIGYESMYAEDPTRDDYIDPPSEDESAPKPISIRSVIGGLFIVGVTIAAYYFFF